MGDPFGVASNCTVKEPLCVANAVLCTATTLVTHVPGGGAAETVSAEVPLCPSLVAVIVADPAATPLTSPLPLTVATAVLSLAHVTVRPASAISFACSVSDLRCAVLPVLSFAAARLTVAAATGTADTVIAAVALFPSLAAVIVADPAATPLTRPLPLTVA